MEHLPETLAYAAGLLDGEGCVSIAKIQPTKGNRRVTPSYELNTSVSSTDHAIIHWLKETFGGNITDLSNHPSRQHDGWKPPMSWRISNNLAVEFLMLILPFLKIKRVLASYAIEFQSYKKANARYFKGYQRELDILEHLEAYYQHLNSLHSTRKEWLRSEALDAAVKEQSIQNAIASPLTPVTIAYVAGLFDGEGCIRISTRRPDGKIGKGHLRQPSYCLRIKVANTDKSIIDWLQATFPGYIQECTSAESRARTGNSLAWEWGIGSQRACTILETILPYLRTKHDQAAIAIEYQYHHNQHARYVQGIRSQEVLDRQELYRQQINGMNAKSVKGQAHKMLAS